MKKNKLSIYMQEHDKIKKVIDSNTIHKNKIKVKKLNSNNYQNCNFYKPISKILSFESEK
ncbi:Uncharacterised protein [Elizabethkingia meningoseptica]|nr:Uncharacterised protein [Elizabethkingia meningoseptica]